MTEEQLTPEQVAEMQRKNCIFCKIVSGEIDSKKVYEDDHFLAILDIRPAVPGHVLFLPKEHVPILPLLTEEQLINYLIVATQVATAVQEAMISQRVTIFAASGYAAGQQAPHLILHIIPRERGDSLDAMDLGTLNIDQPEAVALRKVFEQATTQALLHRKRNDLLHTAPPPGHTPVKTAVPMETPAGPTLVKAEGTGPNITPETPAAEFDTTNDALEAVLNMNKDLRDLIIAQPDMVRDYVRKSPKLSKLFEGVNIRALSLMLRRRDETVQTKQASSMTDAELFKFIDGNEGLRTWLLNHPDEFAERVNENPRLQKFFENTDIRLLAKKYRVHQGGI